MKTSKLVVSVLVLALAAGTTAANATSAADATFLQFLAAFGQQQNTQEDSSAGVGSPAPTYRTSCSISRACGDGNTVACTGNNFCTFSTKGVTCDSTEHACPAYCTMGWSCPCPGGLTQHSCSSLRGDCGVTAPGCNGAPGRCKCPVDPIYPCEQEVPPTC